MLNQARLRSAMWPKWNSERQQPARPTGRPRGSRRTRRRRRGTRRGCSTEVGGDQRQLRRAHAEGASRSKLTTRNRRRCRVDEALRLLRHVPVAAPRRPSVRATPTGRCKDAGHEPEVVKTYGLGLLPDALNTRRAQEVKRLTGSALGAGARHRRRRGDLGLEEHRRLGAGAARARPAAPRRRRRDAYEAPPPDRRRPPRPSLP